ncbi:MAG: rRNA maturation RNase YbeY [Flavobacteriales bacterium]|nr:rRNA maturation RNase YbeY [Flavobacteriales bacterium]
MPNGVKFPIFFYSELPDFTFDKSEIISEWIVHASKQERVTICALNYIFCSDDYLLDINLGYLNHNYLTDIITFPYQEGDVLESDIFISLDRVKENAIELNIAWFHELCRVIIHGFLHLCGYRDKTDEEKFEMRNKEDYYLSLLSF